MLNLDLAYCGQGTRQERGIRKRVIGDHADGQLLFLVNTQTQTIIELVSKSGASITVLSIKGYMDLINADLSPDKELIHVTQRISSNNGFAFNSIIFDIHSLARSKDFRSSQPFSAIFFPEKSGNKYQLLHFVGQRMSHIVATCSKKSIEIEKLRGGIHMPNLIAWQYNRKTLIVNAIVQSKMGYFFSEFNLRTKASLFLNEISINISKSSLLPAELSLNPNSPTHLPYFRCVQNRIYTAVYQTKVCVIQQLYEETDINCSFSVNMYPKPFSQIVPVPNATPDIPICFLQFDSIVIIYVSNTFLYLIDISQTPPFTSYMTNPFACSACGVCAADLPTENTLIDLKTGDVYDVTLNLDHITMFSKAMTKNIWSTIAIINSRIFRSKWLAEMFRLLEKCGDYFLANEILRKYFTYVDYDKPKELLYFKNNKNKAMRRQKSLVFPLPAKQVPPQSSGSVSDQIMQQLKEINKEFPSSGAMSRIKYFRVILKKIAREKLVKTQDEAAKKALEILQNQNRFVLHIREALDLWIDSPKPPSHLWILVIGFIILNETYFGNYPLVPCLKQENQALFAELSSSPMLAHLKALGIFERQAMKNYTTQNKYWASRIPVELVEFLSNSSISIPMISQKQSYNGSDAEFSDVSSFSWTDTRRNSELSLISSTSYPSNGVHSYPEPNT